ncbi:tetratricopeptide repeat protein, partial [Streptomyces sp. NPDC090045]|uniref:tetratricopeptide repeat protein n=1 Tax=Streptomyces sp. NPDC090045 TaxID=3365927 RepID=UPI0037F5C31C
MGGVGKTQLAADYAHTAWESGELDVLVWITASTRTAIVTAYAQAGVELCQADPTDPEQAAKSFRAWLTPKAQAVMCRWLIVLDDVADPADLHGVWPPASPYGRTLVTTRRREAALTGENRCRIDVGLFTDAEAAAYLTASLAAHGRREPADQLTALASDLGHLPLALSQAAAYTVDTGLACADYRRRLAAHAWKLAHLFPEAGALPDDQPVTVAAAWSLSIERADQLHPTGLAWPMLQLAALLDPNGIPRIVLTSEPALAHLAEYRTRNDNGPEPGLRRGWVWKRKRRREPVRVSVDDAEGALRSLHRLSLVKDTSDGLYPTVRVHQLIQRASRDTLTPEQHDRLARTAADALLAAWPDIPSDTNLAQTLRANTTALTSHAEDALYRPNAHPVLYRTGRSLGETGQVVAARDHYHHLTEAARHRLSPDHPDTLTARNNLAWWQGEAGDAVGAVAAYTELLEDRSRVLGPDHPDTLSTRSDLAWWRGEIGDAAGAAAAYTELLEDRSRVLGPDHPDTLSTRGDLAWCRGKVGDAAGAVAACTELLEDRLRVLGPNHPHTLGTRGNLAWWRGEMGDAAGAAAAYADLLEDRLRVLGPDHPDSLSTRGNLAWWRGEAGDAAGAAAAYVELLEDRLRVLGPDHPDSLSTRGNLAWWRGEAGD